MMWMTLVVQAETITDSNKRSPGASKTAMETCLLKFASSARGDRTLEEIRQYCKANQENAFIPDRFWQEQITEDSAFVITPHRQNYVLPFTYNNKPNQIPFLNADTFPGDVKPLKNWETKLQVSFKVPLHYDNLFLKYDGLYFGFTLKSFWQVYNESTSRPFRETNYRPEIFYQVPLPIDAWQGAFFTRVGFEHESNGRSQFLSRSWNRFYTSLGFIRDNWVIYLQPWYRIPEDDKKDDGDPSTPPSPTGDDNPDIYRYMGHFELTAVWNQDDKEVTTLFRQNFNTGKGALEIGYSYPMWGRLKGYIQYFTGYGESLIDYDHRVSRISIGVLLTDFL